LPTCNCRNRPTQVIILFSNAITERAVRGNAFGNGVLLAGLGVTSAALSIFW
jgi:hypothetical protein